MARKAAKAQAARNASLLRRTHLTTLALHTIFIFLHFLFSRPRRLTPYIVLTFPTLVVEFYFDRLGRPKYNPPPDNNTLRSPGEDLDASGLMEYLWDVLYWTWGCMGAVCVLGDMAWWLWIVIPLYSLWLGYSTFMGVRRGGLPGMPGPASAEDFAAAGGDGAGESKRQKKLEKRGQRVKYR